MIHREHVTARSLLGLSDLLWHLHTAGGIVGRDTAVILDRYLVQARSLAAAGRRSASQERLWAFYSQVERLAPRLVKQDAAHALKREVALLARR